VTLANATLGWTREDLALYAEHVCSHFPLDMGIVRAVRVLREADLATVESCEGGPGHAYPEPSVKFRGDPAEAWKAVSALMSYGLPIDELRQVYSFEYGAPTGPEWVVTFSHKLD
jgi:hypothetical protein